MARAAFLIIAAMAAGILIWMAELLPRQVLPVLPEDHTQIHDLQPLPDVDMTLGEVLAILGDYDIVHEGKVMSYLRYYGLTDPNSKTIYINSGVSEDYRVETVIHELLHVVYMRKGYDTRGPYEIMVDARAQEIYKQLFGGTK